MLEILSDKCTGCGICDEECPQFVLKIVDGKAKVREQIQCYSCWHCVSACPSEAILLDGKSKKDLVPATKANVSPDELQMLMLTRRSTRYFKEDKIPGDILQRLLDVARNAGTSSNGQTEAFVVVSNLELMRRLETKMIDILWNKGLKLLGNLDSLLVKLLTKKYGTEMIDQYVGYHYLIKHRRLEDRVAGWAFFNAPILLVAHGLKANVNTHANCAIAMRNIELLAHSMGLGTCWSGLLIGAADAKPKIIKPMLGIETEREIYGALTIGYPKHQYQHLMPRIERDVKIID